MPLYERLTGIGMTSAETRISIHAFYALLTERKRGSVSNAQVISAFNLNAGEQTELTTLVARVTAGSLTGPEIHEVLIIAEAKLAPFDSVALVKSRFGV